MAIEILNRKKFPFFREIMKRINIEENLIPNSNYVQDPDIDDQKTYKCHPCINIKYVGIGNMVR